MIIGQQNNSMVSPLILSSLILGFTLQNAGFAFDKNFMNLILYTLILVYNVIGSLRYWQFRHIEVAYRKTVVGTRVLTFTSTEINLN